MWNLHKPQPLIIKLCLLTFHGWISLSSLRWLLIKKAKKIILLIYHHCQSQYYISAIRGGLAFNGIVGRVWCKLGGKSFGTCMTPQLAKILWHITRPRRNRIREHILGWLTTANIKSVTPGILNIVKHFTFEHNNSNQDTMSALTWHQYKCYILIQKLHVQFHSKLCQNNNNN